MGRCNTGRRCAHRQTIADFRKDRIMVRFSWLGLRSVSAPFIKFGNSSLDCSCLEGVGDKLRALLIFSILIGIGNGSRRRSGNGWYRRATRGNSRSFARFVKLPGSAPNNMRHVMNQAVAGPTGKSIKVGRQFRKLSNE